MRTLWIRDFGFWIGGNFAVPEIPLRSMVSIASIGISGVSQGNVLSLGPC